MKFIESIREPVEMGSGYLYLIEAKDFDISKTPDLSNMVNIGYIKDNAVFTIETERMRIQSANYNILANPTVSSTVTFDTNIIAYNPENVARFLTGYDVEKTGDSIYTYHETDADSPYVALVFQGIDKKTGKEELLIMPKCQWDGDFELDYNNENPVALNYHFVGMDVTLPNGKTGAFYSKQPLFPAVGGSANLSALTLGVLRLSPSFNANTITYTASTTNATNTIAAVAEDSEATITIKHGENTVTNGDAITWDAGENVVTVTVVNGSNEKTYTITVTKS